jgi:hypothetical protein
LHVELVMDAFDLIMNDADWAHWIGRQRAYDRLASRPGLASWSHFSRLASGARRSRLASF